MRKKNLFIVATSGSVGMVSFLPPPCRINDFLCGKVILSAAFGSNGKQQLPTTPSKNRMLEEAKETKKQKTVQNGELFILVEILRQEEVIVTDKERKNQATGYKKPGMVVLVGGS